MMKRLFIATICLLFVGGSASAIDFHYLSEQASPTADYRMETTPVEWNREQPRTETISYNSEQGAKDGSLEQSRYFEPLTRWMNQYIDGGERFASAFGVPFAWADRMVFLRVGETSGAYDVYINGKRAGYNQNGSSPAEFDITRFVEEGVNAIEIDIYSDYAAQVLEKGAAGGPRIIGDVYVNSQPKVRVRDFVYDLNFEESDANFGLGVIIKSHLLNHKEYTIYYELIDPSGKVAAHSYRDARFEMLQEDTVRFFASIPNAYKWSHESPHLYTLLIKTQHEGRFGEYIAYKVGLRTVEVDGAKVIINSTPTQLYIAELGHNYDKEALSTKLDELKRANYNAVRLTKPAPRHYYQLCDEKGIYLINQTNINTKNSGESRALYGNPSNNPEWEDSYVDRTMSSYYTTRNHPSVIGFSLADESANGYNLYVSYLTLKGEEHDRPILYMDAAGEWNSDFVSQETERIHPKTVNGRVVQSEGRSNPSPDNPEPAIMLVDEQTATYRVENHSRISNLAGRVTFILKQGWRIVSKGEIEFDIPPADAREIKLPLGEAKPNRAIKYDDVEFDYYFK